MITPKNNNNENEKSINKKKSLLKEKTAKRSY